MRPLETGNYRIRWRNEWRTGTVLTGEIVHRTIGPTTFVEIAPIHDGEKRVKTYVPVADIPEARHVKWYPDAPTSGPTIGPLIPIDAGRARHLRVSAEDTTRGPRVRVDQIDGDGISLAYVMLGKDQVYALRMALQRGEDWLHTVRR